MAVLDGLGTKRTRRDVAVEIRGERRVAAERTTGYWIRPQIRRWIEEAGALDEGGWRGLLLLPAEPEE